MICRKKVLLVSALFFFYSMNAIGANLESRGNRDRHQGPPPEAYTACEGKAVGDAGEFTSPRGENISGICEQQGDNIVLRPDQSKPRGSGTHQDPPTEAYTACEGKNEGDRSEFTGPRGKTLSGICEEEGTLLVLRPDRAKRSSGGKRIEQNND